MATQMCTLAQANKVFPFHSRTLATTVVWLERDEGEGGTDGRCPPSFLTKAGERGETMEGWRQKERIKQTTEKRQPLMSHREAGPLIIKIQ